MVGTSASRKPCSAALIISSEAWYWGCSRITAAVTSGRIARSPQAGSVIAVADHQADQIAPNTITPACRTLSVVSSLPSRREPETKSALPSRIGCTTLGDLVGLVLAVGVDRRDHPGAAGAGQPVAEPQRRALAAVDGNVAYQRAGRGAPRAAVASLAPSTTTITSVARPAASPGISATTSATVGSSL